jgi:hypothetical protein
VLEDHAHCALSDFLGELASACHRSILSTNGASGNSGVVHSFCCGEEDPTFSAIEVSNSTISGAIYAAATSSIKGTLFDTPGVDTNQSQV